LLEFIDLGPVHFIHLFHLLNHFLFLRFELSLVLLLFLDELLDELIGILTHTIDCIILGSQFKL